MAADGIGGGQDPQVMIRNYLKAHSSVDALALYSEFPHIFENVDHAAQHLRQWVAEEEMEEVPTQIGPILDALQQSEWGI